VRRDAENQRSESSSKLGLPADTAAAVARRAFALVPGVPAWAFGAPLLLVVILTLPAVLFTIPAFWKEFEEAWTYSAGQRIERRRMRAREPRSGS
jgi:hypothetical protein